MRNERATEGRHIGNLRSWTGWWGWAGSVLLFCTSCVSTNEWAVVEITDGIGVRLHKGGKIRFVIGGEPRLAEWEWACPGKPPVWWVMDPHGYGTKTADGHVRSWPRVYSGDLSRNGLLALARGRGKSDYCAWLTEIHRARDGELLARMANNPLAVAWSNSGATLAILEIGGEGGEDDPEYLSLWQPESGTIARWEVQFDPQIRRYSSRRNNLFAISWSSDDSHIVVSTRRVPANNMPAKCTVVNVDNGPVCSYCASDAYFVGSDLIIANKDGQWNGACLLRLGSMELHVDKFLGGQMFIAGSDPVSGTYMAWHPPPPLSILNYSLPLGFHDLSGRIPAECTGFAIGSTLRLVRADFLPILLSAKNPTPDAPADVGTEQR